MNDQIGRDKYFNYTKHFRRDDVRISIPSSNRKMINKRIKI